MAAHGCVHINAPEEDLYWSATGIAGQVLLQPAHVYGMGVPAHALTGGPKRIIGNDSWTNDGKVPVQVMSGTRA